MEAFMVAMDHFLTAMVTGVNKERSRI